MKLSKFTMFVEDYPEQGDCLTFHTRTQALMKINGEFKQALTGLNTGVVSDVLKDYIDPLTESGFIVDDEAQEREKLDDFFAQLIEGESSTLDATILTTYGCNFACVYCFEENVKKKVKMSEDTTDAVIAWLKNKSEKDGYKNIKLVFYGGEPLLNTKPIFAISKELKAWTEERGKSFSFAMITNGSMLTKNIVEELIPLGFESVRVSVDGMSDYHNLRRPFLDGRPTFDIIMKNIKDIVDIIDVELAGTYDKADVKNIFEFIDYLKDEGLLHKFSLLGFAPVAPRLGPEDAPGKVELAECLSFIEGDGIIMETLAINRYLFKAGYKFRPSLGINVCPLIIKHGGVVIDPEGYINKCPTLVGHKEFILGTVFDEEYNSIYQEFMDIKAWNKCDQDCPYLPMCQGGCRYYAYTESNDMKALCCKRTFFDKMTPEMIKLEYDCMMAE